MRINGKAGVISGAVTSLVFAVAMMVGAGAASAQSDDGKDRSVLMVNDTKSIVTEVHASNVGTDDWEEDMLDQDTIDPGDSYTFDIDDGTTACYYDFKVVFDDDSSIVKYKVNVCEVSTLHITE